MAKKYITSGDIARDLGVTFAEVSEALTSMGLQTKVEGDKVKFIATAEGERVGGKTFDGPYGHYIMWDRTRLLPMLTGLKKPTADVAALQDIRSLLEQIRDLLMARKSA